MDLRSIKLRFAEGHVRAVVADAAGERGADLEGDRAARVFAAAHDLLTALGAHVPGQPEGEAGVAAIRAVSLDLIERVARLSLTVEDASPGLRIDGVAFDDLGPAVRKVAVATLAEIRARPKDPPGGVSAAGFWSQLYRDGGDGWELGRPTPPLVRWLQAHPQHGKSVLVVGCGRGHEARLVARDGATVVAIDITPEAIEAARTIAARDALAIDFRVGDLFSLGRESERYDLVVEHCCFCAIEVARRAEYARVMADVLLPGGQLVGLFWNHGGQGGPPFSVDRDQLLAIFGERFTPEHLEVPADSVATRAGQEILALFRKH